MGDLRAAGGIEARTGDAEDLVVSTRGAATGLSPAVKHRLTGDVLDRIERLPLRDARVGMVR